MSVARRDEFLTSGRQNQKQRTREALINAAIALLRDGRSPSIAEVAEAARVSPATAYRYFPNPQSLYSDVAIREQAFREKFDPAALHLSDDPLDRLETVIRSVARTQFADEALWRASLRAILDRWFEQAAKAEPERVPVRGTTRLRLVRRALAPLSDRLAPAELDRLVNAVVLVCGVEAMVTTRDVTGLEPEAATEVMVWAARSLVRAALDEADRADRPGR
ncbi:TetR family transcriptional regulator [Nocardia sp. CDC159]|uniref:TetR family transcriptional regulator n=1 Tax=Nocardia pulmonis TaxID=2951408 RepID=A0A9X2EE17_9NOCA|nr:MULTISPECIES: TetR/AcrR family transcriptional regulator [Nocardia]MCM6776386.1 TetR family transcriptional regulator [Nocardia pulmonis]MCM6788810.1 TetR family transcriptional regulator [Nocardia sp. CDC159]